MATIIQKNKRRNRVQFSMSEQLFESHQQNLEVAKDLGATIDYSRDFERWFAGQLEQVTKELERLKTGKPEVSAHKQVTRAAVPQEHSADHHNNVAADNNERIEEHSSTEASNGRS